MEYNCCTNGELPDMAMFQHLEINAVYDFGNDEESNIEALFGVASNKVDIKALVSDDFDPAKLFYTVYGRNQHGEAEALHDESTLDEIMRIAKDLSNQFSLELVVV